MPTNILLYKATVFNTLKHNCISTYRFLSNVIFFPPYYKADKYDLLNNFYYLELIVNLIYTFLLDSVVKTQNLHFCYSLYKLYIIQCYHV